MLELAREVAVEVRGPDTARALLPPGRGRGSSVSSIVCYLTGLSHVDPIANDLLIGRFLNEELTALPDIDLDFPRDIREALIPRVHERYGRDRSALVAAFPTFRARGAIRELGKALGLPPGEIERVRARQRRAGTATATVGRADDRTRRASRAGPRVGRAAAADRDAGALGAGWRGWPGEAHGLPRHLSQHSGGMIVATRPLIDCCPVVPAAMEGRQIVQWDKDSCADAGFLKIDLLGLGMLSAVERCVELIARTRGERIDLSRIPFDDPDDLQAIRSADTTGRLPDREPRADAVAAPHPAGDARGPHVQVAIVRPGPDPGRRGQPLHRAPPAPARRPRLSRSPTSIPSLEPVLRETLGTIIFQDQVIEVAKAFAGFSPGEAEGLRRAMSRKRSEAAIEAYHERFVEGRCATHGVDEELAERVFAMVAGFSGFGFPKAHGAAFGLLAYQSTWLRVHYGPEFLCALLNEQPMGFYPPDALVHEAQRRGIEVLPAGRQRQRGGVRDRARRGRAVRIGLGYVGGARARGGGAGGRAREREGRSAASPTWPRAPGAGRGAGAAGLVGRVRRAGGAGRARRRRGRDRAVAARRRRARARRVPGGTQLALPLDLPAPPALRALAAGRRCSPTTARPG